MKADQSIQLGCTPRVVERSIHDYEIEQHIGEGTFGQVFMARDKITADVVALKKVKLDQEKEGFPITAIREIKILRQLKHQNVIDLKEIVTSKDGEDNGKSIYMVFEYMEHDLTGLLSTDGIELRQDQIKCYMQQLLSGLHYCHANHVLHRDIKGSNLLISNSGVLKLADFGLARQFVDEQGHLTNRVITLWYRAPEVLLGSQEYNTAIDMWSVGCIFGELLMRKAIFQGKRENDQLEKIFSLCGTPSEREWPGVSKFANWQEMTAEMRVYTRRVREKFREHCAGWAGALEFLDMLLTLDPTKRLTAERALSMSYFTSPPIAARPEDLPAYPMHHHEFQAKERRKAAAAAAAAVRDADVHVPPHRRSPQRHAL